MFESVSPAPPDPIFGLNEAFKSDPAAAKINLGAGVYTDDTGRTPVLEVVREAERRLLESEGDKVYLPIQGRADYDRLTERLLLGDGHPALAERRVVTLQTPGGTGALRVVADFLKGVSPEARVWLSDPTWANHEPVFAAAGLALATYPYMDSSGGLDFQGMLSALEGVRPGDALLLQACCHNPSGVDLSTEEWGQVADLLLAKRALPIVDIAYQGFAEGLDADASGLRTLAGRLPELAVANSCSKTFGLYSERVGALTLVAPSAGAAESVLSRVKRCVRANYSNPPAHGAAVVATVLADPFLRSGWEGELAAMRERIAAMRRLFAAGLDERGVRLGPEDNGFITRQRGMFSFSSLEAAQVAALRERFSIYLVGSGRINVAGITEANVDRLCDAVAAVLQ